MAYDYWAVQCKTPDCKTQILVKVIGIHDKRSMPIMFSAKPMRGVICSKCGKAYDYNDSEIFVAVSEVRPPNAG